MNCEEPSQSDGPTSRSRSYGWWEEVHPCADRRHQLRRWALLAWVGILEAGWNGGLWLEVLATQEVGYFGAQELTGSSEQSASDRKESWKPAIASSPPWSRPRLQRRQQTSRGPWVWISPARPTLSFEIQFSFELQAHQLKATEIRPLGWARSGERDSRKADAAPHSEGGRNLQCDERLIAGLPAELIDHLKQHEIKDLGAVQTQIIAEANHKSKAVTVWAVTKGSAKISSVQRAVQIQKVVADTVWVPLTLDRELANQTDWNDFANKDKLTLFLNAISGKGRIHCRCPDDMERRLSKIILTGPAIAIRRQGDNQHCLRRRRRRPTMRASLPPRNLTISYHQAAGGHHTLWGLGSQAQQEQGNGWSELSPHRRLLSGNYSWDKHHPSELHGTWSWSTNSQESSRQMPLRRPSLLLWPSPWTGSVYC